MRRTLRYTFTSLALGAAAACGASDAADTTPETHAAPDFHHADTEKTPESVAEEEEFTVSEGRTILHPEDVVFFEFDSAELSPSAVGYLDTAARWLVEHADRKVVVEGHADPTGPAPYNKDLALRRAQAVKRYLMDHGVPAARIETISLGEDRAVHDQDSMNRRTIVYAPE